MGENYSTKIVFLFHNASFGKDFASCPMIRVEDISKQDRFEGKLGILLFVIAHRVKKLWAIFSIFMGNVFQIYGQCFSTQWAIEFGAIGNVCESHAKSSLSNRSPSNRNLPRIAPDTLGVPHHWHRHRPIAAPLAHSSHKTN